MESLWDSPLAGARCGYRRSPRERAGVRGKVTPALNALLASGLTPEDHPQCYLSLRHSLLQPSNLGGALAPHHRHPQGKATSAAFAGLIGHVAAVRAGNLAGQGQPKARALDAVAQGVVGAVELLEDLLAAASGHAQAA